MPLLESTFGADSKFDCTKSAHSNNLKLDQIIGSSSKTFFDTFQIQVRNFESVYRIKRLISGLSFGLLKLQSLLMILLEVY